MSDEANQVTQEQREESDRLSYWQHAVEYGVQYYIAGRFAAHAHFRRVGPSLLHHAVEMLFKACLAHDDPIGQIGAYREKYGHSLAALWQEFKRRNTGFDLSAYDEIVTRLDDFEDIRYPDHLVEKGAELIVGLYEVDQPPRSQPHRPEPRYVMMLPQIDRLAALLFQHAHFSPDILRTQLTYGRPHAETYLHLNNATPLVDVAKPENKAASKQQLRRSLAWFSVILAMVLIAVLIYLGFTEHR